MNKYKNLLLKIANKYSIFQGDNESTDEWKVRFNTGWCPMTPGMIYYREKIFRCGCSKTHFTQIEIDAKNQHGVIIKNNLKFSSL